MSNSLQKLQAISNFNLLLNRDDIQSQQKKKRKTHSRGGNLTSGNIKPQLLQDFNFNTQYDNRSIHTAQKEQHNVSRQEDGDGENDNNLNKSTNQVEQNDIINRNKRVNSQSQSSFQKLIGPMSAKVSNFVMNPQIKISTPIAKQRSQLQVQLFSSTNRNIHTSNSEKRDFFKNMKSKSTVTIQNQLRRPSDISSLFISGFQSPYSNDINSPKWNSNQQNSQMNGVNPYESFHISKQQFDQVKNQNIKLQKNFEYMRDQVMQALFLLEEEFKNSGKKDAEYKKSRELIQQLVNLLSESAKNELKLTISNTQQVEKLEQISQLKSTIESLQQQLYHSQNENKNLIQIKQENEKEIIKKNRQIMLDDKKQKQDKKQIEQLQKRLELILETNFVEFISDKQSTNNINTLNTRNSAPSSPKGVSHQYQQTQTGTTQQQQNLRLLLSELIKDNEQLKKDTLQFEMDILRYTENEQKLNKKIQTLNQKIENMKKKISAQDLEQLQLEDKATQLNQSEDFQQQQNSTSLLKRLIIPLDADFRINSLKFEYSQILMDLIEHGSYNFALHVSRNKNAEKRTKLIQLLTNQFISYRDFSNRFVQTVKLLHELGQIDDLTKIQQKVSVQFPGLFKAETTRLWMSDSSTNIFYTYSIDQKKQNCFPGKGIFQDVIRGKLPINMKSQISNRYIYIQMNDFDENISQQLIQSTNQHLSQNNIQSINNQLYQYNCLTSFILPIIIDDDVVGILEISDNSKAEGFGQDEELFGVVCANYLSMMIKKIKVCREEKIQIKYSDILNDCFYKCLNSESLQSLEKKIHQQVQDIFGVEVCKFYFVKEANQYSNSQQIEISIDTESKFSSFYSIVQQKAYSYKKGIIGESITTLKPILVNSIQNCDNYDPFVDIKTLLPVYTTPLFLKIEHNNTLECVGVLQIPLKKRTQIIKEKDKFLLGATPLLGVDSSLENSIKNYASLIAHAVKFVRMKEKK